MIGVGERVGRVGVDHQRDRRRSASRIVSTGVEVPSRLDLDLDPPVAGGELALDLRREIVERRPECRSTRRRRCDRACRRATRLRAASPRCRAYRSHAAISTAAFAMLWPRIALSAGNTSRGCANSTPSTRGAMKSAMMCQTVSFVSRAVVRILLGDAFAVPGRAVAVDAHEDEMFVVDAAEAGLEEVDERELHQTQLQTFDLHGAMISSGRLAVPLHRDRRADRRRQDRAGRAARHAARRDGRARGNRESVSRRLLRRPSRRRAAGAALLSAQSPPPADRAAPGGSLQPGDDLRLPVRQGQDLRVSEPRRQRAVHLSAALRSARARRAAARSRRLPAGADRRAAAPRAQPAHGRRSRRACSPTTTTCAS